MNGLTPLDDIKMNGPDERPAKLYQEFLSQSRNAVAFAGDKMEADDLVSLIKQDMPLAYTKGYIEPLLDSRTPASVKKAIADSMGDRAYGKEPATVVNVGVVIPSGPTDEQIMKRFYARMKEAENG